MRNTKNGLTTFQTVSLTDLADCPVIAGEHMPIDSARDRLVPTGLA